MEQNPSGPPVFIPRVFPGLSLKSWSIQQGLMSASPIITSPRAQPVLVNKMVSRMWKLSGSREANSTNVTTLPRKRLRRSDFNLVLIREKRNTGAVVADLIVQ
jgi:hypothetical protein